MGWRRSRELGAFIGLNAWLARVRYVLGAGSICAGRGFDVGLDATSNRCRDAAAVCGYGTAFKTRRAIIFHKLSRDAAAAGNVQARDMTQDTPGTRPDPETLGDGDSNQLPKEDTLLDRGPEDNLDEGYSPPERPSESLSETASEQNEPDTIEERESQVNPEVWETGAEEDPGSASREDPDAKGAKVDPERTGRLAAPVDEGTHHQQDVAAEDVGISGGAASAEEAAMHYDDLDVPDTGTIESDDIDEPDELDGEEFEA